MKFRLQVDGKEYEISATPEGAVTIDGEIFDSKIGSVTPDRRMIQVGEKSYEIRVAESTEDVGCFILEIAGERVPLTVSDLLRETPRVAGTEVVASAPPGSFGGVSGASASAGEGGAQGGGTPGGAAGGGAAEGGAAAGGAAAGGAAPGGAQDGLFAPVPGKIVNVFVKPGDLVDEGAPLVVLEAMKMENELRAPKKGRVTAVLVKPGDAAERGQLLVGLD